jgi:hypothetical protein
MLKKIRNNQRYRITKNISYNKIKNISNKQNNEKSIELQ